ncbi:pentatricopeptide repeat-containing protein [Cucumis melo var. makuwa]|uniref:Pentatricopeptide repeat-containing protein n=1 Tax=Cucumis melo var. makuwa TaxID=1194695 RepID=A0A5A7TMB0_CUCMM|nr:pentatricopeptide repeat-containing protein [Cucumis melo var. makuwa]TYK05326.1 pentatricopeptide repeat-containing protein [Cucumis melo var. makuwa]
MKIGSGVICGSPRASALPSLLLRRHGVTFVVLLLPPVDHVSFIKDVAATEPPQHLFHLLKMLKTREIMKEKGIPFNDANFFEMLSACSILQNWRKATDLVNLMEPSFHLVSLGTINHLLQFLGKSGKTEIMIKTGSGPGPASDDSVELADVDSSLLDELLVMLKK